MFACVLSDESSEQGGPGEGPAVLIGDGTIDVALEEGEHWKPDACTATVLVGTRVRESVVIQEETCGDVKGDEDVDGVMLMGRQDEEDPEQIQHPGQSVDEVPAPGSVYKDTHTTVKINKACLCECVCEITCAHSHSVTKKLSMVRTTVCPLNI